MPEASLFIVARLACATGAVADAPAGQVSSVTFWAVGAHSRNVTPDAATLAPSAWAAAALAYNASSTSGTWTPLASISPPVSS